MKISYIEKFLILATLIMLALFVYGRISKTTPEAKVSPKALKSLDLGMTFEEFKKAYDEKVMQNESPLISLENAVIEDNKDSIVCKLEEVGIVMVIFTETESGKISRIAVLAEPFYNRTKEEKTFYLVAQSTVWSLAAEVFSPNMEQQKYRESAIKRIYNNRNIDYMMNGDIRYKAVQNGKVVALFIEAKDLPN